MAGRPLRRLRNNPRQLSEAAYTGLGKEIFERVITDAHRGSIESVLQNLSHGYFEYGQAVGQAGSSVGVTGQLAHYLQEAQAEAAAILFDKIRR